MLSSHNAQSNSSGEKEKRWWPRPTMAITTMTTCRGTGPNFRVKGEAVHADGPEKARSRENEKSWCTRKLPREIERFASGDDDTEREDRKRERDSWQLALRTTLAIISRESLRRVDDERRVCLCWERNAFPLFPLNAVIAKNFIKTEKTTGEKTFAFGVWKC